MQSGAIDSVQTIVNIFDPLAFDSLVPICQHNKVSVIARCVLDEGGLSGFLSEQTRFDEGDFRADYFNAESQGDYIKRVEQLRRFIPEFADSLAELALRYVLSHAGITCATVSMHVPEYASMNIHAANQGALPSDVFEEIRKYDRWLSNLYQPKYFPSKQRQYPLASEQS